MNTLTTHNLLNCPNRMYNMDESGLPLDHKPSKVIALKGANKKSPLWNIWK